MVGSQRLYERQLIEDYSKMFVWYHYKTEKFIVSLFKTPISNWFRTVDPKPFLNFIMFCYGIEQYEII